MRRPKLTTTNTSTHFETHSPQPPPPPPPKPPQSLSQNEHTSFHILSPLNEEEYHPHHLTEEMENNQGGEDDGSDDDSDEEEEEDGSEEGEEEDGEDVERESDKGPIITAKEVDEAAALRRQKLADGFYEVETIKKKRICKGVPQYLIKWRGWPESANTWEPVDHLQTCPDVVEAYEESLRSGQRKSSRKRKRKFTQPKKKMQYSYGASKSKNSPIKMTLEDQPCEPRAPDKLTDLQSGMVKVVVQGDEGMKTAVEDNPWQSIKLDTHVDNDEKNNGFQHWDKNLSETNINIVSQQKTSLEGDKPANGQSNADCVEASQPNQQRGAKRRKSSSVRRFQHDISSRSIDQSSPMNMGSCDSVEPLVLGNSNGYCKKKLDSSSSPVVITKIVKPICYSTTVTNNVQDVSVTFVAKSADGTDTIVDNKYLGANFPHVLINYYEQHLRYIQS